jgi:hypothetical protein
MKPPENQLATAETNLLITSHGSPSSWIYVAKVHRYNGSTLVEEMRIPVTTLPQIFSFAGARWSLASDVNGGVNDNTNTSELRLKLDLVEGVAENISLLVEMTFPKWSVDHYVLFPGVIYAGNRFEVRPMAYPPILSDPKDMGVEQPPRITDVLRLETKPGKSGFQLLAGAMAVPSIGVFDPARSRGLLVLTCPFEGDRETSYKFAESDDRSSASLEIVTPGVRQKNRYAMLNTGMASEDRGADLMAGDSLELHIQTREFACRSIPQLFERLLAERYRMTGLPVMVNELPFSAAWDILEQKYNRDNWNGTEGYYRVGLGENRSQDFQPGWVGGLMNTLPLIHEGSDLSRGRAMQSLDFVFAHGGQGESGFFHGCYHQGVWSGDGFDLDMWTPQARPHPERNHYNLLRKSADVLYFLFKQFDLLAKQDPKSKIPDAWLLGARRCAEAFQTLWTKYGQLGQFVDIHTGEILIGGSASAGIAPAGMVLAAAYFQEPKYLKTAVAMGEYFHRNFTQIGLTNGGPGEALQCPDSESAAGLLEAYVALWEATGQARWLGAAEEAAAQLASWQMSYNYPFPKTSEFGRLGINSAGGVFANSQNGHGAPGICTHSGNTYLKLYRATGKAVYKQLLQELAHNLPQYLSRADRPIYSPDGRPLPSGWINERVNTSDWDDNLGGVFHGSCWPEVSLMLTCMEIPGIYVRTDTGEVTVFDHVEAVAIMENGCVTSLRIHNPTAFPATVKIFAEHSQSACAPLGNNYLLNSPTASLPPGDTVTVSVIHE